MKTQNIRMSSYALSDIGLARANNEDCFLIDQESQFYALADGMGGHNAGEIAAEETLLVLQEKIKASLILFEEEFAIDRAVYYLKNCIAYANHHIHRKAKSHPSLKGMGTTLCCILAIGKDLIFAHVGDSRVYRFRKKLTLLTKDHSLRSKVLALGQSPTNLLKPKWGRNVITRSIGTSSRVEPEIGWGEVLEGDLYLLCSDGLTDYVPESLIDDILDKSFDIKTACEALITIAKCRGGRDNITVLIVKIES